MAPLQRKLLLLGYRSVGKSSLCNQYIGNNFKEGYEPTIENTYRKPFRLNNQDYVINIVDTAGQDEYSLFSQYYTVDIHGYILVYSVTSRKSFEVVEVIFDKLIDMVGEEDTAPIVLVGNKIDLKDSRQVSTDDGKKLADKWKAIFLETSAKKNEKVPEIFQLLMTRIERQYGGNSGGPGDKNCTVM